MDVCLVFRMLAGIKCVFYVTMAEVHVVLREPAIHSHIFENYQLTGRT